MIKDNDFIHLPELYLTLESLKKHIKQHYNLNITNMANENKHSGYNDEQMAMTQLDIIHRYSVKLETMISEGAYLEEWVKMKLSRVELMIASVKHALEGVEKFEDGGELARKQLLHISKYSAKLIEMLKEGSILMSWMESNIAICADYMDGIYHHLDYTMGNRAKQMEYRNGGGVDDFGINYNIVFEKPDSDMAWKETINASSEKEARAEFKKKHPTCKILNIFEAYYSKGGGVGRTHTLLEKRISSIGDQSTKAGRKDRFNVVVGYINEAYDNKEISKAEAIDFYKQAVEETDYLNEDKAFESKFNVTEYNNGGGVEEYADGGRVTEKYFNRKVYNDWAEAKEELETFLKISGWKSGIFYDAVIESIKGTKDYKYKVVLGNPYKKLWRVYFDTAITARNQTEAKEKLIKDKKWYEDRLGRFDVKYIGEVTKFNDGGEVGDIPNMYSGKTAEQVWDSWTESQRKHFCYDHELMDNVSWKTLKMSSEQLKRDNWGKEFGGRTSWDWIKNVLQEHIEEGQYKNGGGVDMANKFPTTKDGWEKFMDEKFAEFKKVETEYMAKYNPHWEYKYEAGFWRADKDGKPVEITLKEGGSRFPYTLDGFLRHIEELKSKIEYRNGGGVGKFKIGDEVVEYKYNPIKRKYVRGLVKGEILEVTPNSATVKYFNPDGTTYTQKEHLGNLKKYSNGGGIGDDDDDFAENVSSQEIEGFIDYFMDAYNILSSYDIYSKDEDDIGEREEEIIENERDMIRRAILEYFDELQERREKNYTWGGGDTLDRERVKIIYDSNFKKGGLVDGGGIDSYGDMNPEQVWNNWSSAQRYHFIYDHMKESTPITQEELSKKAYSFLPANVKQELHEHIHMGKYNAGGGVEEMREIEYADGGTVGTGKNAKALMKMDNDIWDKLNIDSGSQLYSDEKLQKKYAEELSKGLEKMGFETYTLKAGDILTDWNYHALRSAMTFMGYFGETEKNNQLEYKRETKKLGLSYYGLTPEIFTK